MRMATDTKIYKTITHSYFDEYTHAATLAAFRVLFGIMMFVSIVRFWAHGWIEKLYIDPSFHFSYYGFEWVKPIGAWTYLIFIVCALSAIGVALGWKYRWSITAFFLSFTYIELMDKTTYLNHYYFISAMSFLMIFLPAGRYFSMDARESTYAREYIPRWTVDSVKLLLGIVYFYAGLAKLNYDWLVQAMPLKIWLPGRYDIPLIGHLLEQDWVAYAFSWSGMIYDLLIPFALLFRKTRPIAFVCVVVFHVLTRVLFPIGMFPYIMIISTLIFFDASLHKWILNKIGVLFSWSTQAYDNGKKLIFQQDSGTMLKNMLLVVFFSIQILLPFRYLLYPGPLFWTEEGYRFSWRVMLMEKAGIATFTVVDGKTGKRFVVDNTDFLTSFQEKQMSTQPDFIVEYAHYLCEHFRSHGHQNIEIYVDSFVALNGRSSKQYIDPRVDLTKVYDGFAHKKWILPFE